MKNQIYINSNERGAALILTLSVLSIILLLGVAFLFSSRNALVVADAQVGSSMAGNLAYSAIQKQMTVLRRDAAASNDHENYLAGGWPSITVIDDDNVETTQHFKLSTNSDGHGIDDSIADKLVEQSSYLKELDNKFDNFITNSSSISFFPLVDNDKVYGRYGYAVIDESGKFDLNAVVSRTGNAPFVMGEDLEGKFSELGWEFDRSAGDFYYDIEGEEKPDRYTPSHRRGNHINEIKYPSIFRSQMLTVTKNGHSGKKGWDTFHEFHKAMKDSGDLSTLRSDFLGCFRMFGPTVAGNSPKVKESDINGNYICRDSDRFDISGFEWAYEDEYDIESQDLKVMFSSDNKIQPSASGWNKRILCRAITEDMNWWDSDIGERNYGGVVFPRAYDLEFKDYEENSSDKNKASTNARRFLYYLRENPAVAYHIRDYCDADNHSSFRLKNPAVLAGGAPVLPQAVSNIGKIQEILTGNEKVPYINEIAFTLEVNPSGETNPETGLTNWKVDIALIPKIEMVNIFDEDLDADDCNGTLLVYFEGSYSVMLDGAGTAPMQVGAFGGTRTNPITFGQNDIVYDSSNPGAVPLTNKAGQFWRTSPVPALSGNEGFCDGNVLAIPVSGAFPKNSYRVFRNPDDTLGLNYHTQTLTFTNVASDAFIDIDVKINRAVVVYTSKTTDWTGNIFDNASEGAVYDVAVTKNAELDLPWMVSLDLPDPYGFTISYEVSDPRCNENPDAWRLSSDGTNYEASIDEFLNSDFTTTYIGQNNSNFEPNDRDDDDDDREFDVSFAEADSSDNKTFSTAYIRNSPFRSIWELGAIHTGKPYKTVDLSREIELADHDIPEKDRKFYLVDCVKVGPGAARRGMMNPNCDNECAFMKLFEGISLGDKYNDVSTTTSDVVKDNAYEVCNYKKSVAKLLKDLLLDCTFGSNDKEWDELTDCQRESYMARCVPFLSNEYEMYTIVVYAEALEELEYPAGATPAVRDQIVDNARKTSHIVNVAVDDNGTVESRPCRLTGTSIVTAQVMRNVETNEISVYNVVQE